MNWTEAVYHRTPVSFQNWLLSLYGRRLRKIRFGPEYRNLRGVLEGLERASLEEQETYQSTRLSLLIQHCYDTVPYYREVFVERGIRPESIRQPADLNRLPILTKDDIRKHFRRLLSTASRPRDLRLAHTSGTTGSPLACYWDSSVDWATNAVLWTHRSWAGFEFGRPYASLLGRVIVPPRQRRPPFWRVNRAWTQLFLSSFHLDENTASTYLRAMSEFGAEALEAYPSTAYVLAAYLSSQKKTFPLKAVFTSAETLLPDQRLIIEKAFACPVYDYFGEAERVLFAGECGAGEGLHLFTGYGITEVTDDEGRPRRRGQAGHLVLTGLYNFAMPLLRYRLGDVSAILDRDCGCGRKLPLMHPVTTKAEDIVVTPEGRYISSSVLTHPFKPMVNIKSSQIVQEDVDHLVIRIVPRPAYSDHDTRLLIREFRRRVGPSMRIDVERVSEIPRTVRGKLRWVVSKIPLRFGAETVANLHWHQDGLGPEESPATAASPMTSEE